MERPSVTVASKTVKRRNSHKLSGVGPPKRGAKRRKVPLPRTEERPATATEKKSTNTQAAHRKTSSCKESVLKRTSRPFDGERRGASQLRLEQQDLEGKRLDMRGTSTWQPQEVRPKSAICFASRIRQKRAPTPHRLKWCKEASLERSGNEPRQ